jgi:hypothetical protein
MIEVTHLYCPASGGREGEDNTTHHLVPRSKGQTCRYCGKTERELREEAESTD